MICLGLAALFALPAIWNGRNERGDLVILISGTILTFWFAAKACLSPVPEAAQSDLLLLSMAVSTFVTFRAIGGSPNAQKILVAGIALLAVASLWVIAKQIQQPGFSPIFPETKSRAIKGFYGHYSYGGSFLVAVSFLLGGFALHSKSIGMARAALGVIAILGIAAIYYTRSRGAILGAAGGFGALALCTLIVGNRDNKKWFAPALLAIPVIAGGIIFALLSGWSGAQEARNDSTEITAILDNGIRWHLAGIAISCITLHPMFGGGARSFSWECFRFWDTDAMGQGLFKPEHVHNELLQTACDYGIMGAALLLVFLTAVLISVILRSASGKTAAGGIHADGWRIGGIAGLAGLFTQSNFEGILRIAPGAILLALCISAACYRGWHDKKPAGAHPWFRSSVFSLLAAASALPLLFAGIKGTRVSLLLWPGFFGADTIGYETRIDALSGAINIWPLHSLIMRRGIMYQEASGAEGDGNSGEELLGLALADYRRASSLHRFDPQAAIGLANILSTLGRNAEAESAYSKAVELQGGMEAAFKAHYYSAKHYHRKAVISHDPANPAASLADMEIAVLHMEEAVKTSWIGKTEDRILRVQMYQDYGLILESAHDYKGAIEQYDFASKIPYGGNSHYYAGQLLGRLAVMKWAERHSEDAMQLFMQASHRINAARNDLPANVTGEKRDEYAKYLLNTINYLKGAGIKPSASVVY